MRSSLLARRTRSLIKSSPIRHRALSSTHALRFPRKDLAGTPITPKLTKRSSSSVTPSSGDAEPPATPPALATPSDPPKDDGSGEEPERPRRRRSVGTSKDPDPSHPLPSGLDILWTPEDDASSSLAIQHALPPPEIFEEILHNLHITLHPQTQHRATYPSPSSPPVEPNFALYCPVEGGDVYVDETVREMARRTGAEVVVLDSVQLAAGSCGEFGKGAPWPILSLTFGSQGLASQLLPCCNYHTTHCISPRPPVRLLEVHHDKQENGKKMTGMRARLTPWCPHE